MKAFIKILLLFAFIMPIQAKMQSRVELTKIRSVTVEDDKIVIVGDGVFRSRLVTTEEEKDSD